MPNRSSIKNRRIYVGKLAASLVSDLTRDSLDKDRVQANDGKDPAAVALGRKGGLKGGKARAEKLSPERRKEIAQLAAQTRWGKRDGSN